MAAMTLLPAGVIVGSGFGADDQASVVGRKSIRHDPGPEMGIDNADPLRAVSM